MMRRVNESKMHLVEGKEVFSGNVSIANNGGFASVRTQNFETYLGLSGYEEIKLRVQS